MNAITNHLIRVIGSKIQIAGWSTYVALINSLKLSMLAFYIRLMVLISIISDSVSQQLTLNRMVLAGVITFPFMLDLALLSEAFSQVS